MCSFWTKISNKSCFYCQAPLYHLSDGRVKCSNCKRRYSLKKLQKRLRVIELFCKDYNSLQASKELKISYQSIKRDFDKFRKSLAIFLEDEYQRNRDSILEYDEYIFLDHSKRKNKRAIFDGVDFLTFDYGGKVYNILMAPLDRYKASFLSDGLEEIYYREFSKFLKIHRVSNIRSYQNTIIQFWSFFDEFIKKFKGIKRENFFYYLKEAEFKFNYPKFEQRVEILVKLELNWFDKRA